MPAPAMMASAPAVTADVAPKQAALFTRLIQPNLGLAEAAPVETVAEAPQALVGEPSHVPAELMLGQEVSPHPLLALQELCLHR